MRGGDGALRFAAMTRSDGADQLGCDQAVAAVKSKLVSDQVSSIMRTLTFLPFTLPALSLRNASRATLRSTAT
jgi:hypothetical protein